MFREYYTIVLHISKAALNGSVQFGKFHFIMLLHVSLPPRQPFLQRLINPRLPAWALGAESF